MRCLCRMFRETQQGAQLSNQEMTLEEFTRLIRRVGIELSAADTTMLFDEIAASCRVAGEMTERIASRLSRGGEPAHIFLREGGNDAS